MTSAMCFQDALNAQQLDELFDDVDDDMLMQASGAADANEQSNPADDGVTAQSGDVTTKIADSDDDDDVDLTMLHRKRSARFKDDEANEVGMTRISFVKYIDPCFTTLPHSQIL